MRSQCKKRGRLGNREDATTETYLDVHHYLNAMAYHFVRRHGGDYEELRSEANVAFMLAFDRHNRSRMPFVKYLGWKVGNTFKDELRHRLGRLGTFYGTELVPKPRMEAMANEPLSACGQFSIVEFCHGLSEDATAIVNLILETPKELRYFQKHRSLLDGLYAYLEHKLGWENERIIDAFRLIQKQVRMP